MCVLSVWISTALCVNGNYLQLSCKPIMDWRWSKHNLSICDRANTERNLFLNQNSLETRKQCGLLFTLSVIIRFEYKTMPVVCPNASLLRMAINWSIYRNIGFALMKMAASRNNSYHSLGIIYKIAHFDVYKLHKLTK